MISRAKREDIYLYKNLSDLQQANSEHNVNEYKLGKTQLSSLPRRIILELTNACNLNCIMCGRNVANFKPTYLEFSILEWLSTILDTVEEVTLMGWGEPTLYPEFEKVLEFLDKFKCRKYICTNGMLLEKYASAIVKKQVDLLAISLNGATEETNNKIRRGADLNHILSGVKKIRELDSTSNVFISFVFCAMKSNFNELPLVIELAHKMEVKRVKVVHLTAFSEEMKSEVLWNYQDEIKRIFELVTCKANEYNIELELPYVQGEDPAGNKLHADCIMPWRDVFVGADGLLRSCMSSSQVVGDICKKDKSFEEYWNSKEYQELRKNVNGIEMSEQCSRCYQSSFCNWNLKKSYIQVSEEFSHEWK